jgi:hypothetical protein
MGRTIEGVTAFRLGLLAFIAVLLPALGRPVQAQRQPLPPREQNAVNRAIEHGVEYLKKTQLGNGAWPQLNKGKHAVGYAALPGLTLLECDVPAGDPAVQRTARFLRSYAARTKLDATYELSLAILFLDRLGDPKDEKIIREFALRLIAGQSATGGWGYKCPILSTGDSRDLLAVLRRLEPPPEGMPLLAGGDAPHMPGIAAKPRKNIGDLAPIAQRPGGPPLEGTTARPGNRPLSDTTANPGAGESRFLQSPTAGNPSLWRDWLGFSPTNSSIDLPDAAPHKKDLKKGDKNKAKDAKPNADKAADAKAADAKAADDKAAPQQRKRLSIPARLQKLPVVQDPAQHLLQDPAKKAHDLILTTTDNSNTQFAILALWTAQRHGVPMKRTLNLIVRRYVTSQNADGGWGYHYRFGGGEATSPQMTCVGLIGLAVGHGLANPAAAGQQVRDPRILNGFVTLSKHIGQPADRLINLPLENLYYLWSLERVAVLYDLPAIGDKDWYRWGAEILVANQNNLAGNWAEGKYPGSSPPLDTCLALLFLKRANLVKDLTARLPFNPADLNDGVRKQLAPPSAKKPEEPIEKLTAATEPPKPSKPAEPDTPLSKPVAQLADTTATPAEDAPESPGNSKTKVALLCLLLFAVLVGGGLFVFLIVINREKKDAEEDEGERPRRKPKGAKKKRKSKSMASGQD